MIEKYGKNFTRIVKLLVFLFLEVLIFYFITQHLGGIVIPDFETALVVIALLSVINAIIWPTVSYFSLRFIVFTLGFGSFLINGFMLYAISLFIPGVYINGISLFTVPLLLALINSLFSLVLGIDDESMYYRNVLKKRLKSKKQNENKPGYIFLEIDGLAYSILNEAIENGNMPFLKKLLDDGSHSLTKWETDLSSQTSSSQAGILHGNNSDIPAFRWVEKENGNKIVSSNSLSGAPLIERMVSNGKGLLSNEGASRSNLFSGDAMDYVLTYSKFTRLSEFYSATWYYLYSSPYVIARILVLFLFDMIRELYSRVYHYVKGIKPCIKRGLFYYVARSGANIVMREATTFILMGDIYSSKYKAMYATYMGYDEIAHHSGIRDRDTVGALKKIDEDIERLYNAAKEVNRDYKFIILSDHGQSGGPTFKQKYGLNLEQLVKTYLPENITVHSILYSNDDHFAEKFRIKPLAEENKKKINDRVENTRDKIEDKIEVARNKVRNVKDKANDKKIIRQINERREYLKEKDPLLERLQKFSDKHDVEIDLPDNEVVSLDTAQTIVLASGNLGLIYFTDWPKRLTYEQIEDAFPGLIDGLATHEGIGFVMVKSSVLGTIVLSGDSVYYLDDDEYDGERFLDKYGEHAVKHLKRTNGFKHVPDILVNSSYNSKKDEVYAFEELVGSHGGLGGTQQEPFIMYPSNWTLTEKIIGAENVHKFFKREINKNE